MFYWADIERYTKECIEFVFGSSEEYVDELEAALNAPARFNASSELSPDSLVSLTNYVDAAKVDTDNKEFKSACTLYMQAASFAETKVKELDEDKIKKGMVELVIPLYTKAECRMYDYVLGRGRQESESPDKETFNVYISLVIQNLLRYENLGMTQDYNNSLEYFKELAFVKISQNITTGEIAQMIFEELQDTTSLLDSSPALNEDLRSFLEGKYITSTMPTERNTQGILPLYNVRKESLFKITKNNDNQEQTPLVQSDNKLKVL